MMGLPAAAAAVRDPLVGTLFILTFAGLLTHFLFRRHPLGRALSRVLFLVILTVILLHAEVIPYEPLTRTGVPFRDAVHAVLKIAWWLWAAWFLVGFLRVVVVNEHRPREGKLVQDLLAGLVSLSAVFAIIAYVFDLPIKGLLATSGAIAIILGLALQSTLSDVFSGIVLNFSRPYRPGDWISIDGGTDGRVIEMNWRATHVLTAKRDLAIVPNSTIAKAKIVNASSPSGIHGMTVTIELDAKTPPAAGAEILQRAILNTQLILATPAPVVAVKSIDAGSTEFDISFFVEELAQSTRAQNELFDRISRNLAAAGIDLASTQSQVSSAPPAALPENPKTAAERAVDLVTIFAGLTEEERKTLAAKATHKHYDQGEALVEPGDVLHSLFVIGAGVVTITQVLSEGEIELLRIGPGDHFGEIGLLTGHAAEATLKALSPVTVYELTKEDLAPVLEARPEVTHELCRALALRQVAGQLIASAGIDKNVPPSGVAAWFSDRLHRLFDLAGAE
jgi:small-conductance mechanosensitive channel